MSHGHSHAHIHDAGTQRESPAVRRALALAVAPFLLVTIIGLVILWPSGERTTAGGPVGRANETYKATIVGIQRQGCARGLPQQAACRIVEARLDEGPDAGSTITFDAAATAGGEVVQEGDRVLLGYAPESPKDLRYYFYDFQRTSPLLLLAGLFAVVVVALSRWRGLAALAGLGVSLFVLIRFMLPAILEGHNPLAVAVVGSAAIMFVALYLAHGVGAQTSTAVLGTLTSLLLTGVLGTIFVELTQFTGFGTEEAVFLQVSADQINLKGLLLGGIIIGALGVLDDVTVTQASAVWELHGANPGYGMAELYRSALRIGRDHIASTVNTLVLAYAGASLPLMILFTLSNRSFGDVVTTEVVAQEIVRTLAGSIGLIASVPVTTALGSFVVTRLRGAAPRPTRGGDEEIRRPRAERAFRES